MTDTSSKPQMVDLKIPKYRPLGGILVCSCRSTCCRLVDQNSCFPNCRNSTPTCRRGIVSRANAGSRWLVKSCTFPGSGSAPDTQWLGSRRRDPRAETVGNMLAALASRADPVCPHRVFCCTPAESAPEKHLLEQRVRRRSSSQRQSRHSALLVATCQPIDVRVVLEESRSALYTVAILDP